MNAGVKLRLAVLGLAAALMGALIAMVILTSQKQAHELRERLSIVDLESFGIADHFKDALREVNNASLRYRLDRDPSALQQFVKVSHELDVWIDEQSPKQATQQEKDILKQVDAAYDDYMRAANEANSQVTTMSQEASAAQYLKLRSESQRLFDLGQELAKAHYESRNQLLAHANQTLTRLRFSELGLLGLLFVFAIVLAIFVYRDMIAPLRVKLVESQAQVERHEKLASLGMLAAGVAHEIRNPLTAIKAALFIQEKKFKPGTPEYADTKLVGREILRLERIVNDFLLFARPTDPNLALTNADQPLQEIQTLFASEFAESHIHLVVQHDGALPINIDGGQIKQVLINLVRNAAESIGQNGTITLRSRGDRKRLGGTETDVVILEVADTGKGISPEVERRLFDPFFTTKESGTGLGLSIAARIIEKHGGMLQYQTQVNVGATFGIVLPKATA